MNISMGFFKETSYRHDMMLQVCVQTILLPFSHTLYTHYVKKFINFFNIHRIAFPLQNSVELLFRFRIQWSLLRNILAFSFLPSGFFESIGLSFTMSGDFPAYANDSTFWFCLVDAYFASHPMPEVRKLKLLYCNLPPPLACTIKNLITHPYADADYNISIKIRISRRNTDPEKGRFRTPTRGRNY